MPSGRSREYFSPKGKFRIKFPAKTCDRDIRPIGYNCMKFLPFMYENKSLDPFFSGWFIGWFHYVRRYLVIKSIIFCVLVLCIINYDPWKLVNLP